MIDGKTQANTTRAPTLGSIRTLLANIKKVVTLN